MEKVNGIEIRECVDLGPVIARADHRDRAIEVNRKIFYRLPPMVQEFVLCHEVCHLTADEWDETRTNLLAADLFLSRSVSEADRREREEFLAYIGGKEGDYSNWVTAAIAIVGGLWTLGTSVYGVIRQRNAGWYSWDDATKQANLKVMLTTAFEQSRKSSTQSAAGFFWELLSQYDNKDGSLERFRSRSGNEWVDGVIRKYEQKYGFGFEEVTPVDIMAFTAVKVGIGVLVGVGAYLLVRKIIKNRKK